MEFNEFLKESLNNQNIPVEKIKGGKIISIIKNDNTSNDLGHDSIVILASDNKTYKAIIMADRIKTFNPKNTPSKLKKKKILYKPGYYDSYEPGRSQKPTTSW